MKYVLFYEPGDDTGARTRRHFAEHSALWESYSKAGTLLMIGPFTDGSGAMGVFTTRAAAEKFACEDPFVAHGVVARWYVREWKEALIPES